MSDNLRSSDCEADDLCSEGLCIAIAVSWHDYPLVALREWCLKFTPLHIGPGDLISIINWPFILCVSPWDHNVLS